MFTSIHISAMEIHIDQQNLNLERHVQSHFAVELNCADQLLSWHDKNDKIGRSDWLQFIAHWLIINAFLNQIVIAWKCLKLKYNFATLLASNFDAYWRRYMISFFFQMAQFWSWLSLGTQPKLTSAMRMCLILKAHSLKVHIS